MIALVELIVSSGAAILQSSDADCVELDWQATTTRLLRGATTTSMSHLKARKFERHLAVEGQSSHVDRLRAEVRLIQCRIRAACSASVL